MVHNAVNDSVSHKRSRQSLCDAVASTSYQKPFPAEVKKLGFFELDFGCKRVSKINRGVSLEMCPIEEGKKAPMFFDQLDTVDSIC